MSALARRRLELTADARRRRNHGGTQALGHEPPSAGIGVQRFRHGPRRYDVTTITDSPADAFLLADEADGERVPDNWHSPFWWQR